MLGLMSAPAAAENLCTSDEEKLFECRFENSRKSVSICQSKSDKRGLFYKFGTQGNIELSLPNKNSGQPYIRFEKFGPASSQWIKQIIFPYGKLEYTLSTPQGISAILSVEGLKSPVSFTCETGDSGSEIQDLYLRMEALKFKRR